MIGTQLILKTLNTNQFWNCCILFCHLIACKRQCGLSRASHYFKGKEIVFRIFLSTFKPFCHIDTSVQKTFEIIYDKCRNCSLWVISPFSKMFSTLFNMYTFTYRFSIFFPRLFEQSFLADVLYVGKGRLNELTLSLIQQFCSRWLETIWKLP